MRIDKIKAWFAQLSCSHTFIPRDLEKTNIPTVSKPNGGYPEWSAYFADVLSSSGHTKRVRWPCSKCKRSFYAHCGLDIAENGKIIGVDLGDD